MHVVKEAVIAAAQSKLNSVKAAVESYRAAGAEAVAVAAKQAILNGTGSVNLSIDWMTDDVLARERFIQKCTLSAEVEGGIEVSDAEYKAFVEKEVPLAGKANVKVSFLA